MPGSGKTTLGKQLAEHLRVDFVDLDAEIEKEEQKSISDIFSQKGEDYFRLLESKLLHTWAASSVPFVMATGGGAPCFLKGMDVINAYGTSIFLDCSVPELIKRVRKNTDRPLLLASDDRELQERLDLMLSKRRACYEQSAIILQNATLEMLLERLDIRK